MRRILFAVMGLLALFTILRVHGQSGRQGARYILQPGVLEFETAEGGGRIAFGLLDLAGGEGQARTWNLLPLRITLQSGKQSFSLALNGLSLLASGGLRFGKPVRITGRRSADLISLGGEVTVAGTVEGDIWTLGAGVRLLNQAVVTGNVVALGGRIESSRGALVKGNKYSLPNLKIPLLSLLSSGRSAATLRFLIELMGVVLHLLALALAVHFARDRLAGMAEVLGSDWKLCLLYLLLALLLLPLLLAVLAATIVGILAVPFLVLAVVLSGYLGYLACTVRIGLWISARRPQEAAASAYAAGLLGLLVVKGPTILGILLDLLASQTLQAVGRFLYAAGTAAVIASALYGFGGVLRHLRVRAVAK